MNPPPNKSTGFRAWVSDLSPTCKHAVRLQSAALDQRLPWRQRVGLRIHLWLCRWCRRYGQQIRFLRNSAQQRDAHDASLPSQALRPEARAKIKTALREQTR